MWGYTPKTGTHGFDPPNSTNNSPPAWEPLGKAPLTYERPCQGSTGNKVLPILLGALIPEPSSKAHGAQQWGQIRKGAEAER